MSTSSSQLYFIRTVQTNEIRLRHSGIAYDNYYYYNDTNLHFHFNNFTGLFKSHGCYHHYPIASSLSYAFSFSHLLESNLNLKRNCLTTSLTLVRCLHTSILQIIFPSNTCLIDFCLSSNKHDHIILTFYLCYAR